MPFQMTAQFGGAPSGIDVGFAITEDSWEAEGAQALASESGGFTVRDTNDLASGLRRIADENGTYYLVGYNPSNPARDGRFRKITVKVPGRPGIEIRARKGYYAPDAEGEPARRKPGVDPVFQEALDAPYAMGDIPLRMTSFVQDETLMGKARVVLVAEVDVRALLLEMVEERYRGGIGFLLVAVNRETGDLFRYDQKVDMRFLPATRERLLKTWFPIRREFELPQGSYQAKIVVRDLGSSRVATVAHKFEVPDLAGLRVSTPVLTDAAPERTQETGEQALPVARREFEQGGELYCQFEVYGAKQEGSTFPRVAMGYAVRRADGTVFKLVEPVEIRPTSLGKLSRLFRFGLQGVPPGEYDLVMAFYDILAEKQLEIREPFSVRPAGALGQSTTDGGPR
jgi:hypothetical protein